MTHICVSKLAIIGSDNGLSPDRRQAIIWTNSGILLIGPFGTQFSEILIEIYTFSFKKMYLKMSSGKCRPFCLGINVLKPIGDITKSHNHKIMVYRVFLFSNVAITPPLCQGKPHRLFWDETKLGRASNCNPRMLNHFMHWYMIC